MTEKNVVQTLHDTLQEEMQADDRVVVLGEDVGARGGVFRVTAGFLDEFGEHRVIDTPLAESSIVGVAIGMAFHGLLPVAEIQFADFIHPAFDQLVSEAARIRYRSNGDFGVPMVVRAPWGGGVHGALYVPVDGGNTAQHRSHHNTASGWERDPVFVCELVGCRGAIAYDYGAIGGDGLHGELHDAVSVDDVGGHRGDDQPGNWMV